MAGATKRGRLIVFEGIDKSGKSTQASMLLERLSKLEKPAHLIHYPHTEGPVGELLDSFLRKEIELSPRVAHLIFSANRWEHDELIQSQLRKGKDVILDRYVYSGLAYGLAAGLPAVWCAMPDTELTEPDLTIFLDISEHDAAQRAGWGEERYEEKRLQSVVRNQFKNINKSYPEWVVIDATLSPEEIHEIVFQALSKTNPAGKPGYM